MPSGVSRKSVLVCLLHEHFLIAYYVDAFGKSVGCFGCLDDLLYKHAVGGVDAYDFVALDDVGMDSGCDFNEAAYGNGVVN